MPEVPRALSLINESSATFNHLYMRPNLRVRMAARVSYLIEASGIPLTIFGYTLGLGKGGSLHHIGYKAHHSTLQGFNCRGLSLLQALAFVSLSLHRMIRYHVFTEINLELREFQVTMSIISNLKLKILLLPYLALLNNIKSFLPLPYSINVVICLLAELPSESRVTHNAFFRRYGYKLVNQKYDHTESFTERF